MNHFSPCHYNVLLLCGVQMCSNFWVKGSLLSSGSMVSYRSRQMRKRKLWRWKQKWRWVFNIQGPICITDKSRFDGKVTSIGKCLVSMSRLKDSMHFGGEQSQHSPFNPLFPPSVLPWFFLFLFSLPSSLPSFSFFFLFFRCQNTEEWDNSSIELAKNWS